MPVRVIRCVVWVPCPNDNRQDRRGVLAAIRKVHACVGVLEAADALEQSPSQGQEGDEKGDPRVLLTVPHVECAPCPGAVEADAVLQVNESLDGARHVVTDEIGSERDRDEWAADYVAELLQDPPAGVPVQNVEGAQCHEEEEHEEDAGDEDRGQHVLRDDDHVMLHVCREDAPGPEPGRGPERPEGQGLFPVHFGPRVQIQNDDVVAFLSLNELRDHAPEEDRQDQHRGPAKDWDGRVHQVLGRGPGGNLVMAPAHHLRGVKEEEGHGREQQRDAHPNVETQGHSGAKRQIRHLAFRPEDVLGCLRGDDGALLQHLRIVLAALQPHFRDLLHHLHELGGIFCSLHNPLPVITARMQGMGHFMKDDSVL
mmetsp:Transcript_85634/g.142620  ORF Transcript_85634/g.142620 Transcript_85634/m.142620 type:complete len:369 (-) Transcript_85634:490-1596(-)